MVTLIRTLKRINKSAPPALAQPAQRSSSRSSKTKIIVTTTTGKAPTPRNIDIAIAVAANHLHHGSQLKKTANTATDDHKLNEKVGAKEKAPSNNMSNDSPSTTQKALSIAIANTSNVSYDAAAKSNERNIQALSDRKRKSSSDKEPAPKKVAWEGYRYECSADGCTNHVVNRGVCMRHGAKVKRCSSGGCTNYAKEGGVCVKHGAKTKRCSSEGCNNKAIRGGVCRRHGAKGKLCSSEGCTNYAQKGGVCIKHGAKIKVKRCRVRSVHQGWAEVKRCSSGGCTIVPRMEECAEGMAQRRKG